MVNKVIFCVLLAVTACTFRVSALESTDIEKCSPWNPPSPGPLNTWSAPLCKAGQLVAQPFYFYYRTRGTFNELGNYKAYKDGEKAHQSVWDLILYYGVTDRLEVDAETFYNLNYTQLAPGINADDSGFADSYLYVRYCLTDESSWMPCLTAIAQMRFPTGAYQKGDPGKLGTDINGTGSYDQGYGLIMTKKVKPLILHADFIYNIPSLTRVDGVKTRYANYFNIDCAAELILPKGFSMQLETNYVQQGDLVLDGTSAPATDYGSLLLVPGVAWSCEKVKFLFCYQRTIAGVNANVNDSFAATIIYTF